MTLNCFPRMRIVHTSSRVRGQIYIPEVNWCLMTIGVALILGFTLTQPDSAPVNTAQLGNAFGARPFTSASFLHPYQTLAHTTHIHASCLRSQIYIPRSDGAS
jgi:hypothetical protein